MKKLFLILLLVLSMNVEAQVMEERAVNQSGQTIVRFYNSLPRPVSCFYQDNYNYFTFIIPSNGYSMWYPVYGYYKWQCR